MPIVTAVRDSKCYSLSLPIVHFPIECGNVLYTYSSSVGVLCVCVCACVHVCVCVCQGVHTETRT